MSYVELNRNIFNIFNIFNNDFDLARPCLGPASHVPEKPVPSFRGSAAGREPGIHNRRSGSMDSGLASASLRRPGITRLSKVDTLAPRVLTQAGLERVSLTFVQRHCGA